MSFARRSTTWELQTRQLLLPKLGQEASECEDVIAINAQQCRFAVADGATEAFDSRNWAERLAQHWVQHESALTAEEFRNWVATEGRELHDVWKGLSLSWYSEEKARAGSFAAFAGLELDLEDPPSWKVVALGDTCLLHCRRGMVLKSLPLSHSEKFNTAPVLVASDSSLHETSMQSVVVDSGTCKRGDVLLLMSDALASWYLQGREKNEFDPDELLQAKPDAELAQFFDDERSAGRIRNDDLALVRIEITERRMS